MKPCACSVDKQYVPGVGACCICSFFCTRARRVAEVLSGYRRAHTQSCGRGSSRHCSLLTPAGRGEILQNGEPTRVQMEDESFQWLIFQLPSPSFTPRERSKRCQKSRKREFGKWNVLAPSNVKFQSRLGYRRWQMGRGAPTG